MKRTHKVLLARRPAIRVIRAESGITVKQLAKEIGKPEWQVRHTLQGQKLHRRIAEAVAEYFGVPVSVLFLEVDLESLPESIGDDDGQETGNSTPGAVLQLIKQARIA